MQTQEQDRLEYYAQAPLPKEPLQTSIAPYTPNNPPWSSLTAFLMWLFSVAMIIFVPSIGLIFYLMGTGVKLTDPSKVSQVESDPNTIFVNVMLIIPAHIITIVASWLVVTNINKLSFTEMLGWKWGKLGFLQMMGLFFVALVFLGASAYLFTSIFGQQDTALQKILGSSRNTAIAIAIMATFTAPLVEEVVYRGLMYSAFQRRLGVAGAVGLVTLLFALVHVPQYYESIATVLVITLMSLILTLVRVISDNLLPCIVLHTLINGIQSIGIVAGAYTPVDNNNAVPEPVTSFFMSFFR